MSPPPASVLAEFVPHFHVVLAPSRLSCASPRRGTILTLREKNEGGKDYKKKKRLIRERPIMLHTGRGGGVWGKGRLMRSASIRRRMQEKRKKNANSVYKCVWGGEREREREREKEREAVSSKEAERKWQTWPEERKGAFEKDNPWETACWTRCPVSTLLLPPSLPPSLCASPWLPDRAPNAAS